ncbi:MAG: hypothetical protein BRD33_03015 [Bacteroidetes bacterium QH_6_63_17]|nr:MAG: hypothetical protein BRD33_03015 [Bacteroidetes bacterium QH_6_63_17]
MGVRRTGRHCWYAVWGTTVRSPIISDSIEPVLIYATDCERSFCIRFDDDWPSIFLCSSPGHRNEVVRGPAARGIHGHAGGILYVIFWTVVVVLAVPSLSPWTVAGGVFIVTCGLEFLQLWSPAWLEAIRDTFFGHALPGSTFGR